MENYIGVLVAMAFVFIGIPIGSYVVYEIWNWYRIKKDKKIKGKM